MNILLVDDEIDVLDSLRRGLRLKDHEVFEARSAAQALDCLQQQNCPVELVITDYSMPVMNGIELLEAIRKIPSRLPVILMTGYTNEELVLEAGRHHCDGFLEKPFALARLLEEMERIDRHRVEKSRGLRPGGR